MLTLAVSDIHTDEVQKAIASEDRLHELISLVPLPTAHADAVIDQGQIHLSVDWSDTTPPVLLPHPLTFSPAQLLSWVFVRLGNWEKAYALGERADPAYRESMETMNDIRLGVPMSLPRAVSTNGTSFGQYRAMHNQAIAMHYGHITQEVDLGAIYQCYQQAFEMAPDPVHQAFTAKHFATFLLDQQYLDQANDYLGKALALAEDHTARVSLLAVQYQVWLQKLTVPYDPVLLERTKQAIWEVLTDAEKQGEHLKAGLTLLDAAQVANFTESFSEALGYINRAVNIFQQEEVPELEANAQYRKGVLLFTWAQNGNPQFYKGAMLAYQEATKMFNQENAPYIFAEIQHHLGVIYSEIPDEVKKKSIWAAVSSSSFKQALEFFTQESYPYEYATICNHYANALTKYPQAKLGDNYRKALGYYREALKIRTPQVYPYERALTILNYLEACWLVGEDDPQEQKALFAEMQAKAKEIDQLVTDTALRAEARLHLEQLAQLKEKLGG
jgi:tetratricopeptide (TPR) repeat protein